MFLQRTPALRQMLGYVVDPLQKAVQARDETLAVLLVDRATVIVRSCPQSIEGSVTASLCMSLHSSSRSRRLRGHLESHRWS